MYILDYNPCYPDPCHHGECVASGGTYTCTCNSGYHGSTCDGKYNGLINKCMTKINQLEIVNIRKRI